MASEFIRIVGARQHNLKNLTLEIPREKLVVITGLSGSGKSSLAFDTLYAEGQRRYVESLSAYARQFLDQMQKPDVEHIEGLSPAIAIEQRGSGGSPRSTIATTTEIYDYLRVLYASIGQPHDPKTGRPVRRLTPQQIVDAILALPTESRIVLLAPIVSGEVGEFRDVLEKLRREGFVRVRVDGEIYELSSTVPVKMEKGKKHRIEAVVDRLVVRDGIRQRLSDSVTTALKWGEGKLVVLLQQNAHAAEVEQPLRGTGAPPVGVGQAPRLSTERRAKSAGEAPAALRQAGRLSHSTPPAEPAWEAINFSIHYADPDTGFTLPALTPKHFSFNSHYGACPTCEGLGSEQTLDAELIVQDAELSLAAGAVVPWAKASKSLQPYYSGIIASLCRAYKVKAETPWSALPEAFQQVVLAGSGKREVELSWGEGSKREAVMKPFDGVIAQLQHLYDTTDSELSRQRIRAYMGKRTCAACGGARLRPAILAVTLASAESEKGIHQFCQQTVSEARWFIEHLVLGGEQRIIATELVREIKARLNFMEEVGLGYLSLDRESGTLSGGEAQRIRLATQIGSGLAGCLYVLDEPSIGLHQRDNDRLITTLRRLRDLGNSVIVVEHDEDTIRAADHVLDLGPGAGIRGGEIIAQGTPAEVEKVEASLTGQYLAGTARIPVPKKRVPPKTEHPRLSSPAARGERQGWLSVVDASENNLQNVTAHFPLGCLTCVTGVSGSGKSTLVDDILRRALFRHFYRNKDKPGRHRAVLGLDQIDKAIVIDQAPIGRTPRSNPVTYTGAFGGIRDLFAGLPPSRLRGYEVGRFSFNVKGGRCEACEGDGVKKIEMHFLADVYVECEVCRGRRYNRETLEITYKGKNIADVLDMTVDEASRFFRNVPGISDKLRALEDVGLGYLHLGQSGTTLSGGEAQRIKLAAELSKRATGRTVYILDEPTTGLHFADIHKLLEVLLKLRDSGNTLIIIEHNLEVIKCADWLIDMGPEGGTGGGQIVAEGTPEDVAKVDASYTGRYLRRMFARQ